MTGIEGLRWYVVQTQPHAEAKATAHLLRQGFDTYLPRYLKRRRHARRVETVAAPLFPRYLFVAVDMAVQRWRVIQSTIGVSHLVSNGDSPAAVAASIVDGLKAREDERGFVLLERRPRFAPGDKIRVLDGVFSACLGLFEGVADRERVAILLDLLGRKVRVTLDADIVTAA
jgi:transcriptional antiterminator RfaH